MDDYGDERGGTLLTLHGDGTFDIEPVYARDAIADYAEKYYIDYDAVAAAIENDPDYTGGPIIRGTDARGNSPPNNKTRILTHRNETKRGAVSCPEAGIGARP